MIATGSHEDAGFGHSERHCVRLVRNNEACLSLADLAEMSMYLLSRPISHAICLSLQLLQGKVPEHLILCLRHLWHAFETRVRAREGVVRCGGISTTSLAMRQVQDLLRLCHQSFRNHR